MKFTIKKTIAAISMAAIAGCTGIPVDQLHVYNGLITTGGEGNRFEEIPVTSVSQKDRFYVVTHVRWDNVNDSAGIRAVKWQWFSADKLVAERSRNFNFRHPPFRIWYAFPAADFAIGHYRVDILIDDKVVDTQQFDITK